jgi:predicted O-methyltransferase YrrM
MDQRVEAVLGEYAVRNAAESAELHRLQPADLARRIDEFLIPVGPVVGMFLNELIKAAGAKTILELGMSYGYTSIYLAEAARATGGRVITTEIHPDKIVYAKAMHKKAGLEGLIEIREGDALKTLSAAKEKFDFVLVDLWKDLYVPCLELFYPKLSSGAYVAADNMILPPYSREAAMAYRTKIRAMPHIDSVLLALGSGIELSRYTAGLDRWGIAAQ